MLKKPIKPDFDDCCQSECPVCIWDIYYEELAKWQAQQAEQEAATQPKNQQQD